MCPACITSMTLLAAGTTSSGGLAATLIAKFSKTKTKDKQEKNQMKLQELEPKTKSEQRNIVSENDWLVAREELLKREKELTRQRDEVSRRRRELPWVKVEKEYLFAGKAGEETLADLFDGRSQLIVYHFMLGPGWEEGCKSCSYLADHFDGANWHLPHRDVTLVVISRAPFPEIEAYQKRMGWRFKWVSSSGSDFNFDYHVSFTDDEEKNRLEDYQRQAAAATTTIEEVLSLKDRSHE